jgi:hypothetical protein
MTEDMIIANQIIYKTLEKLLLYVIYIKITINDNILIIEICSISVIYISSDLNIYVRKLTVLTTTIKIKKFLTAGVLNLKNISYNSVICVPINNTNAAFMIKKPIYSIATVSFIDTNINKNNENDFI